MRLIDEVLLRRSSWPAVPSWEEVAQSNVVASFRAEQGSRGDLARRIEWGASAPLPGWRMSWRTIGVEPLYALTDLRDPCGFTLSSQDLRVIPRRYRLVPIGTC